MYKITQDGKVGVFATGLKGPIDIVSGVDGNFYVSEWKGASISSVSRLGKVTKYVDVRPGPGPMTTDKAGNIYVSHNTNDGSGYITKISSEGEATIYSSDEKLVNPGGLDFDNSDNLYVANFNNANVVRISPGGQSSILATIPGDKRWRTGHLEIIDGVIYVSALMGHRIYRVEMSGEIHPFVGTGIEGHEKGGFLDSAISSPNGLAFDSSTRKLYFTSAFSAKNYIQRVPLK